MRGGIHLSSHLSIMHSSKQLVYLAAWRASPFFASHCIIINHSLTTTRLFFGGHDQWLLWLTTYEEVDKMNEGKTKKLGTGHIICILASNSQIPSFR